VELRTQVLQVSYAILTILGAIVISMLVSGMLGFQTGIILILISFLLLLTIPPFRLSEVGFGEIINAVVLSLLSPAFAFLLQENEIHRILPMTTFPLLFMATAWLLAENFLRYSSDQKLGRRSMLIGLTWQHAVPIHHVLILVAYLIFAVSPLFGFSWRLVWPVFISLPFAILQIIWLQRIANGERPVWRFFTALIRSVFGLTIYLLALSFWLR
jgi:1,4-dihydroxy-2-naphthoate octaprenyltransferase